jgi:outer membrane protein OmpA-like peptidoglycan-associated protein
MHMKTLMKTMIALGLVASGLLACAEDLTPVKALWDTVGKDYAAKVMGLKKDNDSLVMQLGKLAISGDANGPAGMAKAALMKAMTGQTAALGGLEKMLGDQTKLVGDAIAAGKLAPANAAIETAKKALGPLFTNVTDMMKKNQGDFSALEKLAAAAAVPAPAAFDFAKLAKSVGTADFSDIDFKSGSAEFSFDKPASKATLDSLVGFAKTCPELRIELVGHTSKDGDAKTNLALSGKRADAVKDYLLKAGVAKTTITKTSGMGSTKTLVAEPDAASPEAKAMDAAALASIRNKNRRVEVAVKTPCK